MLENSFVKESFSRVAKDGYLGDPDGGLAYCYLRVSSAQQAEEGRSGLPRQIQHCHDIAVQQHLKIPWEMVFADDGFTGFEFEKRPALSLLRAELKKEPRSRYVVIEHLDRLSRNARWHQGFLLDEFAKYHITPVFWKAFGSEIERAVLGTIAEEGMRSEISRMTDGLRLKARSGRVTAKRPRYGYMFVDSEGKASDKVRQDTHYALHPEHSKIMRWVYDSILSGQKSLGQIASEMNANQIPPCSSGAVWCAATLHHMVCDPVYKGEFYAHRWYREENGELNAQGRPKGIMRQRPPEEWIKVEVPAIVSPEEWQLARDILTANQKRASRNMKKCQWLLSSMLKCAICQYAYSSQRGGYAKQNYPIRYYKCLGRVSARARIKQTHCQSPHIRAEELEHFVWAKVEEIIENEELVLRLMEEANKEENVLEVGQHLDYLDAQLADATQRYERWKTAYEEKVITLKEYGDHRTEFHRKKAELMEARTEIERKHETHLSLAEKKRIVSAGLGELRQGLGNYKTKGEEVPFEVKRRLLLQLLDCIWIDAIQHTIRLDGVLKATYEAPETNFVFSSSLRWR